MSSNKTANLQLNQWQAGDAFLREEFNQDNGKIDAAVQGADLKIAALMAKGYVAGTYVGSGSVDRPTRVDLGFSPLAVVIASAKHGTTIGAVLYRGVPVGEVVTKGVITETGFKVTTVLNGNMEYSPALNISETYIYIAFR